MTFAEHVRSRVLEPRLKKSRILTVFDPAGRYEEICLGMTSATCTVLNTTGKPLSSRFEALRTWQDLGRDTTYVSRMLIYSRDPVPVLQEDRMANPFSAYVAMGSQFPDGAQDDFQQLCLTFLPERRTEIAQLFEGGSVPEIQHLDNLAGGSHSHPRLEAIFGTGEATAITIAFLVPSPSASKQLDGSDDWCTEFRQLLDRVFGFKISAKVTKAETIRAKLWQFLLFSEFASDLPTRLPEALAALPQAEGSVVNIVNDVCEKLRTSDKTREAYREAANTTEAELQLREECRDIDDLGELDTFAFEEARFLKFAAKCVGAGKLDRANSILLTHQHSLWTEEGERQLLWRILHVSLDLLGEIKIGEEALAHIGANGADLTGLYAEKLSNVDLLQRELDSAVLQLDEGLEEVEQIIDLAHHEYRRFTNLLQEQLISAVQREGWPLHGLPASRDTFNQAVHPLLNDGKRVAYFLTDALRLELAQKLSDNLSKSYRTEVTPVCAQLPCVTRFAMASLLPDAGRDLTFREVNGEQEPFLGSAPVGSRTDRLKAFESHLGDRVTSYAMTTFIEDSKTPARREKLKQKLVGTDLLVVTSTELDSLGEGSEWLRQYLAEPLDKLLRAVRRCADLGFQVAVIAADHGFLWIDEIDAGSTCQKPSGGEWVLSKRRCLIGTGDEPHGSVKFATAAVGIPCDAPAFIVPRSIGVYQKGSSYFHEGLSIQESLVGRMVVHLSETTSESVALPQTADLELSRKRSKVSSLIVSVNLAWPGDPSLFTEASAEFDLVAVQGKEVVGFPTASERVDPATNRVRLKPGDAIKVNLRLDKDAITEGAFKIKVLDLKTDKALDTLDLTYEPNVL